MMLLVHYLHATHSLEVIALVHSSKKGKKGLLKLLCNNQIAVQAFLEVGTQANVVSESAALELEKFVCAMYGKPTFSNTNKVRYKIFKSQYELQTPEKTKSVHNGVDFSLLPPCRTSLQKHCQRMNYQAYVWRHAHDAPMELPSPDG